MADYSVDLTLDPAREPGGEDDLFMNYYEHRFDYWIYMQKSLREDPELLELAAGA